jgi:two-component system, NarL family, response regulator NreC
VSATGTIRVILVDDHAIVRSGLRLLLEREDDIEVVGEAGSATEARTLAGRHTPDVVLLDVVMPGASGVDALPEILERSPESRVLMLSMQDDPSYVRRAFERGAQGYMLKEAADAELVEAIRRVAAGDRYVHPALGARLAAAGVPGDRSGDDLSDREREVLGLLAMGHTNQEIAQRLVVSVRTVESHRAHILTKLRATTRAELVRHALRMGLVDRP